METKPEDVMNLLQNGTPTIELTATHNTETMIQAVEFAKSKGYKVSIRKVNDPADPGGCMSLLAAYKFNL